MWGYVDYLSTLKFDDLPHWTPAQYQYLRERGYDLLNDPFRKSLHVALLERIDRHPKLRGSALRKALTSFKTFNHWFSAV